MNNDNKLDLLGLEKLQGSDYTGYYLAHYHNASTNTLIPYTFISRNTDLEVFTAQNPDGTLSLQGNLQANAVKVFVFNKDLSKMLITREFRMPLNSYILDVPSGLVDVGDSSLVDTALRELQEEVGYSPSSVTVIGVQEPTFSSAGLTDEMVASVYVLVDENEVNLVSSLSQEEDITFAWVSNKDSILSLPISQGTVGFSTGLRHVYDIFSCGSEVLTSYLQGITLS